MRIQTIIALCLCTILTSCGPSAVRKYAGILAADTVTLNAQFEALTKSRGEIERTRDDLSDSLQLAILQAEDYNARRLDVWRALKGSDQSYDKRLSVYASLQAASEAAFSRYDSMRALSAKLNVVHKELKGNKSDELAEAAKSLAALSKEMSLIDSIKFLAGFGQNVQSDLKKAEHSGNSAAQSATEKANEITQGEIVKGVNQSPQVK